MIWGWLLGFADLALPNRGGFFYATGYFIASALIVYMTSFIGTVALIGFEGEVCLVSSLPYKVFLSELLIWPIYPSLYLAGSGLSL